MRCHEKSKKCKNTTSPKESGDKLQRLAQRFPIFGFNPPFLGLVVYGFNLVKFHCRKVNEEVPEVEEGHVKAVDSC